jgi:lysophospholipase L1-like esterase
VKTLLKILSAVAVTIAGAETLLFGFGFPTGIQLQEGDLRVYDDVLVYRLRPNVTLAGKRTPYFVHPEIRTNSLGLRDREFDLPKRAGRFRILSLGDSGSFGWGVREEECYAKRLEGLLNGTPSRDRYEVVNAGVPSYESWRELIMLERLQPSLEPDLVICQVSDNDLGSDAARWKHAGLRLPSWFVHIARMSRLITLSGALSTDGIEGVRELRARGTGADTVARSQAELEHYMRQVATDNDSAFACHAEWIDAIVENYARMDRAARGSFVCLLLPNRYQISEEPYRDVAFARLEEMLRGRGLHVVNLVEYLRACNGDSICLADSHPNARGHGLIADTLAAYLHLSGVLEQ